jgi:outer membrane protein assembly factor BamB
MGFGTGTSLLLYQNLVIVNANAESERLVALDTQTGREVWKADAKGYRGCWSTPVLLARPGGKQNLVVHMPDEIWALNPSDGGLLWYCSGLRGNAISSVVAANEIVYAVGGGPGGSSSLAIRAGGRDDVSASHVLWKQSTGSYVPSPLVLEDHIYWVDDRGTAYCLKADSGEQVYRQRLTGAGGVYASVVAGDGKLYAVTRRKGTFVLATGPKFKVLAQNRFISDTTDFNASPAISHGYLVLRSNRSVYCVTAK